MRRLLVPILLLLGMLIPVHLIAQQPAQPADPERDAVRNVILEFAARLQANDMAALEAFFPQRGVHILTDNAPTHGWAEYRDKFLKPEIASFSDLRYAHTAVEPVVQGNIAWVAFRRELSSGTGSPAPVQGRGTAVLQKVENRWVIRHLHMSR